MQTSSKRTSLAPWLLVGGVIALMATVVVYRQSRPAPAAVAPIVDVPAAQPTQRRHAAAPRPAPSPADMRAFVVRRQQAIAQKRAQLQARVDKTQATFASRYQNEPVDAAWASAKEADLMRLGVSDQIRQLGVEARNLNVDCKRSMCRVTADFPNVGAGDDWFSLYMNNLGDKVPVASYKYVQRPDGSVTINMYAQGRR